MARGGGMQGVELDELGEGDPELEAVVRPSRRRMAWWVAGAVVVVGVGVLGLQVVADARERAAVARLADVPGVLAPVAEGLPVAWRSDGMDGLWRGIPVGDAVLIPAVADDGSQALVAHDLATGEVRWSTELYGPDPARAEAEADMGSSPPECTATTDGAAPGLVACLASNGYLPHSPDGSVHRVPATASFVRVIDTADGRIVAQWPTTDGSLAVLEDVAVVASYVDEDGAISLDARDLMSGAPRWDVHVPAPEANLGDRVTDFPPHVYRVGEYVDLASPNGRNLLYAVDGSHVLTELDARDASGSPGGLLFRDRTSGRIVFSEWSTGTGYAKSVVLADRRPGFAITGSPYVDVLDDGSVPGLLLVSSADARKDGGDGSVVLKAVDVEDGEPLWTAHVKVSTFYAGAMILRGRVFVLTLTGLAAVDGRTGELLWTVDAPKDGMFDRPMTDGRHLLLSVRRPDGAGENALVALDPATGDEAWRCALPEDIDDLYPVGHALLGTAVDDDGEATKVVRVG